MEEDKPIELFPELFNIKDFLCNDHPTYHPDTQQYMAYWKEQEKRCLEGMWGNDSNGDKGGWRYMPGFLYYYINLCMIIQEKDLNTTTIEPMLRDVEWMLSYGWLTARSFSGFINDEEFTCHRLVEKLEKGEELNPKDKKLFERYEPNLRRPDGKLKKYVYAIDYLYRTHSKPLGKPLYENNALNFFVLGSRGFGKSFFCANAVIGHEYNFYGKRNYDSTYLVNPSPVEIFVGSAIAAKATDLLDKFKLTQEYLKTGPGSFGTVEDFIPGFFFNNSTGTLGAAVKKPYTHRFEVKENGIWKTKGTGTVIKNGTYTSENPQAAVGTRPTVMVIEEVGLLGNLLTVHGSNETCQIRDNKFGSSFYIGTGGNMEKIIESKIVFEDPEAYNFVQYKDQWEGREKPIGFFLPAYYVDNDFKDVNGNTDVQASFNQEIYERELRKKAKTSNALNEYIMSRPIKPSEMFLSAKNRFFPVAKLKERVQQLMRNPAHYTTGTLEYIPGSNKQEVKWIPDSTLKPLDELSLHSNQDTSGAIKIYEHPPDHFEKYRLKRPFYKIGYDPVKDDEWGTSHASIIVYKGVVNESWAEESQAMQNNIVAEYIGRLEKVEDIHEICVKLCLYFGSRVMVENNLPDFIRYCRLRHKSFLLQPSPWEAITKIIKNPGRKYDVGVTMNKTINVQSELLINDWLHEDVTVNNQITELLYTINSIRLLLELINYNREGNFDHVSALKLLVLWIKNEQEYATAKYDEKEHYMEAWNKSYASINSSELKNTMYVY